MPTQDDPYEYGAAMAGIHQVFRDAVSRTGPLVASVGENPGRRELVGSYLDNVWQLLHVHHQGEDKYLTPLLLERGSDDEVAEAARVGDQHQALMSPLAEVQDRLTAWSTGRAQFSGDALVRATDQLASPLMTHLDNEEQIVVPLAIRYLAASEWNQMPRDGLVSFTGDKLWLIIGLIQEQMPDERVAVMNAHMAPSVAQAWTASGRQRFADEMATLRSQESHQNR